MADYYGFTRTNYFEVTDEDKFRKLMARCAVSGDAITIFEQTSELDPTKVVKFGFGAYGSISGLNTECNSPIESTHGDCGGDCCDDPDYCHHAFCAALQELVVEGDAVIITEVGHEKLRTLAADAVIITRTDIRSVRLENAALTAARDMLGNPEYTTQNYY